MSRSPQRPSHIANWRRTAYDDDPEPVQIQPGIEAVPITADLEQIPAEHHRHIQAPQVVLGEEGKEILPEYDHGPPERHSLVCGMPRKWFWTLVAAVVEAIAIAIAAGVAVRVKQARRNSSSTTPAATSSTVKGTGMALLDMGVGAGDKFIYFQDYTGKIRSSELKDGAWLKGSNSEIVAGSNVKNGTPIAAVPYNRNMTMMAHLFQADSFNHVQEAIKSDTSNKWVNGSMGAQSWNASESSSVDLSACYNEQYSGGLCLFYGVSNTTIQELSWTFRTSEWLLGYSFPSVNGEGGISCAGGGSGISYLYLLNEQNQLELWWRDFGRDFDTSKPDNPTYSPDRWYKGPNATAPVRAKSAVSYDNNVYFQDPSSNIVGIQPRPAAEYSTWNTVFHVGGGVEALPGTRLALTTFSPTSKTPSESHIFVQTNGSDITDYFRGQDGGRWSSNSVPVG